KIVCAPARLWRTGQADRCTSEYTEKLPPPHDLPQGSGRGIVPAQSDMLEGGADVRVNLNKTQYEHNRSAFGWVPWDGHAADSPARFMLWSIPTDYRCGSR